MSGVTYNLNAWNPRKVLKERFGMELRDDIRSVGRGVMQ
jgi:hypothetical protein